MRGAWTKSPVSNSARLLACVLLLHLAASQHAQDGTRPSATKQKIFHAGESFMNFQLTDLERVNFNREMTIRLARRSDREPAGDDLWLNFESAALFSNPAHQSLLIKSGLEITAREGMTGNAALFTLPSHLIRLKLPDYLNLSGNTQRSETGDFTFACEIEPHAANAELLHRENFKGGRHYLFSVALLNGHVSVKLTNLLSRIGATAIQKDEVLDSIEMISVEKVKSQKRNQILLTYDEARGRLELNVNSREQVVRFLKREADDHFVLNLQPLRAAPLSMFSPFRGYADNVMFTNRVMTTEDLRNFGALTPYGDRYAQRRGTLLTAIYDMGFSASNINSIMVDADVPKNTHAEWGFRCHNKRFDERLGENALRFLKISVAPDTKCRFLQLRARLTADNAGETTPALKAFTLEYRQNPPPSRPIAPKTVKVTGDSVELDLRPNSELDVVKGGRYIIYYGHKPYKAEGAVYFRSTTTQRGIVKGEPIEHRVPIRVVVTNEMLAQNKYYADQNPRFKNRYPILEPAIGFYFWVTACDNAYSDAQEFADHESQPSETVFVRFE